MEVVHGSFLYFTTKIPLNPKERNIKITWNPIKSDDLGGFTQK
jgi:hypothetical protein